MSRKRSAPTEIGEGEEPKAKRPCLVQQTDDDTLEVYVFATVVGLASHLLYLEDFNAIKQAFPIRSLATSLERLVTCVFVRPCEYIEGIPPLNYAKHTCKCPKKQYSPSDVLDVKSCRNLHTLIALRSHNHPIIEHQSFDLRSLQFLRRLYMHAPKSGKSTRLKWWKHLPSGLTDLCLVTEDTVPQAMRLNHMLHLQNLFLCSSIHHYTKDEKTRRGLVPYQHLPPHLTALKIITRCHPHIGDEIVRTLPQSITWLEFGSVSCHLDELPRSLVHLKSSFSSSIHLRMGTTPSRSTFATDEAYDYHVAKLVAEQSPPNWTSFVGSGSGSGMIKYPRRVDDPTRTKFATTLPPTLTDLHSSGLRYEHDEVSNYDAPTSPLPSIKIFRSVLSNCEAVENLPNVQSLAVYLESASDMVNLTSLRYIVALHILLRPIDALYGGRVDFLPSCLKKLAVRAASSEGGRPKSVSVRLNEGLQQLDIYEVVCRRGVTAHCFSSGANFVLDGDEKHLPNSIRQVNFFACQKYREPASGETRRLMLQFMHNRASRFVAESDRPDVPFVCDIRREHYIVADHCTEFSMENHASFFGVEDYNRMWGWKMYYDGK
jgi:hypothetical protein